jgi:predicted permease
MTIRGLWRRILSTVLRRRFEQELDAEIQLHLDLRAEQLRRAGLSDRDATQAARWRFGNATLVTEQAREFGTFAWVDALGQDIRYAWRTMRKNPTLTLTALLTLSFGIGANTAMFSVVDTAILRPLSYRDGDRLVVVHEMIPRLGIVPVNGMHFGVWRTATRSLEQMALLRGVTMNLTGAGASERLLGARVSPTLFSMLGIRAQLGRTLVDTDDQPGHDGVVVLNDELWHRRFNADPGVIGQTISLDDHPYEIVGVLPSGFHFPKLASLYALTIDEGRPEIWKPMALRPDELKPVGRFWFACIARLKPGISLPQAVADLNAVQSHVTASLPAPKFDLRVAVVPLQDQIAARARSGLEVLLAAVGAVLLIGCVNITNLLFARDAARRQEIGVRRAIGASRGRLVRQMLTESLMLAGVGGALGVALAVLAVRVIVASAPADVPRLDEVRLDARVLIFTLLISSLTGVIVGLLPAWRFAAVDPLDAMKSRGGASSASRGTGKLRSLLVGLEVGLSAMCLIAAGLLLHSFEKLMTVEKGFDTHQLVTVDLNVPVSRYPTLERRAAFLHMLLERIALLPGVKSVGVSNQLPLTGEGGGTGLGTEGTTSLRLGYYRVVSPDYFRTMSIPLQDGRFFADADKGRQVALVSALVAEQLWPGESPVGKRVRAGPEGLPPSEVIGVTGDVRGVSLTTNLSPTVYIPYWQTFEGQASLVVKTTTDPAGVSSAIRNVMHGIDPELPLSAFRTMDEAVLDSVAQQRFQTGVVLLFAAAALVLAGLGIYGVVSYAVAQRTTEIGVRMALGAPARRIRWMVLRQSIVPVAIGLGAGLTGSVGLGRLLGHLLFGITASDPITLLAVVMLLMTVAFAAVAIPARRATEIDPLVALRCE